MSNTIWVLQSQDIYSDYFSSDKVVSERFWFTKPSVCFLVEVGFHEDSSQLLLEKGKLVTKYAEWTLKEFGEGELE